MDVGVTWSPKTRKGKTWKNISKHYSSTPGRNDLTCFLRHMLCLCCSGSLVGVDGGGNFRKKLLGWPGNGKQPGALPLMEEIQHHLECKNLIKNNGIFTISTGAGFLPSTVGIHGDYVVFLPLLTARQGSPGITEFESQSSWAIHISSLSTWHFLYGNCISVCSFLRFYLALLKAIPSTHAYLYANPW